MAITLTILFFVLVFVLGVVGYRLMKGKNPRG